MDQQEIVKILRTEGLDIAEDLAANAVIGAFELIRAMLPKINPILPMVVGPILDTIQPMALELIDRIDGEDDPEY